MKIAYSYIRFSTPEQLKGDSKRRQMALSKSWCELNKFTLDESLHLFDQGVSAFKGKNATQGKLGAFIKAVEAGQVKKGSVLLIESLDRLSRNQVPQALQLFLNILNLGIVIVTLNPEERFDLKTLNEIQLIVAIITLSRAHGESALKSSRVGDAWKTKRENIGQTKLTARCPTWLTLSEDRTHFLQKPESVATVKRIFRMSADGMGIGAIVKRLHADDVKPIGTANCWHRSSITKLLNNRSVLGEFTPRHGRGGTSMKHRPQAGDMIPDYYPSIITETDFYKVQAAIKARTIQRGPMGKRVANLFTGLLHDALDGSTMEIVNKGKRSNGRKLVSSAARRGEKGAKYVSFPYNDFELAVLSFLKEIKPADILPNQPQADTLRDQLEGTIGKLASIKSKIKKMKAKLTALDDSDMFDSLMDVFTDLEKQKRDTAGKLEQLKLELHHSTEPTIADTQEIIEMLDSAKGDELTELRIRLKARIRSLVSEIWVVPLANGKHRIALTQVFFQQGGLEVIVVSTGHQSQSCPIAVSSDRNDTADYKGFDFRTLSTEHKQKFHDLTAA
jgi:DNA invertase Pin-like site-specific DNA recombinase